MEVEDVVVVVVVEDGLSVDVWVVVVVDDGEVPVDAVAGFELGVWDDVEDEEGDERGGGADGEETVVGAVEDVEEGGEDVDVGDDVEGLAIPWEFLPQLAAKDGSLRQPLGHRFCITHRPV